MRRALSVLLDTLRAVVARERLPAPEPDPAPEPGRPAARGLLTTLFAPERLPFDPEQPPRRRPAWLRWLFAPERLDEQGPPQTRVR